MLYGDGPVDVSSQEVNASTSTPMSRGCPSFERSSVAAILVRWLFCPT